MNGDMELFLSRGQLKLTSPKAVYSFGLHYRSFGHAFDKLRIFEDDSIKKVLVLGWGIGSISDLLNGHPSLEIVNGVEHDSHLIDFYRDLKIGPYSFLIDIDCADAVTFVLNQNESRNAQYDLVCSDIFVDNITPPAIITTEYLNALTNLCSDNGRVLLSKLNTGVNDSKQNEELERNLVSISVAFDVINTFGNRIYIWKRNSNN